MTIRTQEEIRNELARLVLKTFVLQVQPFAGKDVRDVAFELCHLADRVGVRCEVSSFNGVKLWARPGDNPLRLVDAYHEQLQSKLAHKIAQAA